jgi:hypothetical protein
MAGHPSPMSVFSADTGFLEGVRRVSAENKLSPRELFQLAEKTLDTRHGVNLAAAPFIQTQLLDSLLHSSVRQNIVRDGKSDGQQFDVHVVARRDVFVPASSSAPRRQLMYARGSGTGRSCWSRVGKAPYYIEVKNYKNLTGKSSKPASCSFTCKEAAKPRNVRVNFGFFGRKSSVTGPPVFERSSWAVAEQLHRIRPVARQLKLEALCRNPK